MCNATRLCAVDHCPKLLKLTSLGTIWKKMKIYCSIENISMLRRSCLKRSSTVSERVFVPLILDCFEQLKHRTDLYSIEFVGIPFVESLEFYDIKINNKYKIFVSVPYDWL